MNSFQAKKKDGKRENKKLSFCFVSTRRVMENFKKIKKYHYNFISSQNRSEKSKKGRK